MFAEEHCEKMCTLSCFYSLKTLTSLCILHHLIIAFLIISILHSSQWFCKLTMKAQTSLHKCAGWSGHSLSANGIRAIFSCYDNDLDFTSLSTFFKSCQDIFLCYDLGLDAFFFFYQGVDIFLILSKQHLGTHQNNLTEVILRWF